MNNQTFRANYDHPILLLAKLGNTSCKLKSFSPGRPFVLTKRVH